MSASADFKRLASLHSSDLERLMEQSPAPPIASMLGYEYRGFNTPPFCSLLGIRTFIKGFFGEPEHVEGYNIPPVQNGLDGEWVHKPSPEKPKRFGFYEVRRVRAGERDSLYPNALLLDYGASKRNPALAPERLLRDYVVQPDTARPDLLLGKAYLALGARVPVSYFIIERLRATPWRP